MTDLGNWIKQLPPLRAALGVLFLVAAASGSLGAAGAAFVTDAVEVPDRLTALEESTDTLSKQLNRHITQDSVATSRIYCVVKALAADDGTPINPLDPCDTGRD